MRQNDGSVPDLRGNPAGGLIVAEEPYVVGAASPFPPGVVVLDPPLCFECHHGHVLDPIICREVVPGVICPTIYWVGVARCVNRNVEKVSLLWVQRSMRALPYSSQVSHPVKQYICILRLYLIPISYCICPPNDGKPVSNSRIVYAPPNDGKPVSNYPKVSFLKGREKLG